MSNNYGCGCGYGGGFGGGFLGGFGQGSNCICSLPTLIILILIVLQFSNNDDCRDSCHYDED
jgi:hypothetical protein